MKNHDYYKGLMMKFLDREIDSFEKIEWIEHCNECQECQTEVKDFQEMSQMATVLKERILLDAQLNPFRESVWEKHFHRFLFLLVFVGCFILFVIGCFVFYQDPNVSVLEKVSVSLVASGFSALFLSLLWKRIKSHSKDPYKEIDQ